MSRKLLYLLGILLTILIGTILHWRLLNYNYGQQSGKAMSQTSGEVIAAVPEDQTVKAPAVMTDTSGQPLLLPQPLMLPMQPWPLARFRIIH